ncbi:hypothetical protein BN1088_1431967 [Sphingobacterium sp. PM2-P1-29]|nr:hypothetical protein BN1088_1431967 [Sphingobacterium sp. PM2-P1-29]
MYTIRKNTSLSRQKIEVGDAIHSLENEKSEIQIKINILKRGFSALEAGEDVLRERSILALEMSKIISNIRKP